MTSTTVAYVIAVIAALVVAVYVTIVVVEVCNYHRITMHEIIAPQLYRGLDVPCTYVKVPQECKTAYDDAVQRGYDIMSKSKMVFCILCRDMTEKVSLLQRRVTLTCRSFNDYAVVIFENDSEDNTRQLLKQWQSSDPQHVHLLECPEAADCRLKQLKMYTYGNLSASRMRRMADFRNRYVNYTKKNFSDFDYAIVLDGDTQGPWSVDGIAHTIGQREQPQWDVVAAMAQASFPGTFGTHMIMNDALAYVGDDNAKLVAQDGAMKKIDFALRVFDHSRRPGEPMYAVRSAFNGMAIYRLPAFFAGSYGTDECEHIGKHETMAAAGYGRIFINPALLLYTGAQGAPINRRYLLNVMS